MTIKPTDADILVGALTIYGEARGDTQEGKNAVAHTILNRCKAKRWWGKGVPSAIDHSILEVCLTPKQFSCWDEKDKNRRLLLGMQSDGYEGCMDSQDFRACLKALIDAVDGFTIDHTKGCTHYVTTSLHNSGKGPEWAKRGDYVEIGKHRFFRNID